MATKDYPHVVEFYSYKGVGGIKGNIVILTAIYSWLWILLYQKWYLLIVGISK